jgi:hypothetical protein
MLRGKFIPLNPALFNFMNKKVVLEREKENPQVTIV